MPSAAKTSLTSFTAAGWDGQSATYKTSTFTLRSPCVGSPSKSGNARFVCSSLLQPRSANRTRREGGGCLWKSRSDFQGSVGALSASMAPAASRALQARQLTRRHLHGHSLILHHERWQAKLL